MKTLAVLSVLCALAVPSIRPTEARAAEAQALRLAPLKPKARITAAGLARLAQQASRPRPDTKEAEEREPEPIEPEEPLIEPGNLITNVSPNDPPPQRTESFSYSWPLRRSFRGNRYDGFSPLDPALAAGPAHLVAMTNLHIVFYTKMGDSVGGAALRDFFLPGPATPSLTDPRVEYDPGSGRFFAMCLSFGTPPASAFQLAVSNGSDPTAGWTLYEINSLQDGCGIDYPYMGFGSGAVYFAGNYRDSLFGWPAGNPRHANGLWVLDKAALVAGTSAATWRFTDFVGQSHYVSVMPCARWSAPPGGLDDFLLSFEGVSDNDWLVHVWGVTLPGGWPNAPPTLDHHSYTTPSNGKIPNAPQLGGPALLNTNGIGSPPCLPTFMNGHIYTALHSPSGGALFVREYDVNVSSWTSVNGTTKDFWDGSSFYYYPSVAISPWGDVGLIYTRSSTLEYASAIWSICPQDEGAFLSSGILHAGEAYYGGPGDNAGTVYRWGDYSGAATDPVTGGMWFLNMYAATGPFYSTWIGYVPHAVFVDASFFFFHTGSRTNPWTQFLDGYNSAWNENDLVLKAGSYHAGSGVLNKPLTIKSDGGTATITP